MHDRKHFECGEGEVTRFLREQALQDQEKDLSRTMVLADETTHPARIIGYHTLLMVQVRQEEIPKGKPKIKAKHSGDHARPTRQARWYEAHDFIRFPKQLRMFKSIQSIRKLKLID